MRTKKELKTYLDTQYALYNQPDKLSGYPDPLIVAKGHQDERVALVCALFAYGNVKAIVKFLQSLDFSLLNQNEQDIKKALQAHYYRFQTSEDICALFIALSRLEDTLENIFTTGYRQNEQMIEGILHTIKHLQNLYPRESRGYQFLLGQSVHKTSFKQYSTYKRWNLFLKWMVRSDNIDMGLWRGHEYLNTANLIIPMDTHLFGVGLKLRLIKSKQANLQTAMELTNALAKFDKSDPTKYDFALYRIGQNRV